MYRPLGARAAKAGDNIAANKREWPDPTKIESQAVFCWTLTALTGGLPHQTSRSEAEEPPFAIPPTGPPEPRRMRGAAAASSCAHKTYPPFFALL